MNKSPYTAFKQECAQEIEIQGKDSEVADLSSAWMNAVNAKKYSYHFEWLGRPIIQYPQDMVAMQELIWSVRPDLIIETGIAHGGSLILSASMLAMIDYCEAVERGSAFDPLRSRRKVIGVDIDIRAHNRDAIENHPLAHLIEMYEGSSIDPEIVRTVTDRAAGYERVLVTLDSNHTHDHVLAELEAYAPLATSGSYCVVFDTVIEDMPEDMFGDRPWGVGDNPKTAVWQFLKSHPEFQIDRSITDKILVTVAPDGYLKRAG